MNIQSSWRCRCLEGRDEQLVNHCLDPAALLSGAISSLFIDTLVDPRARILFPGEGWSWATVPFEKTCNALVRALMPRREPRDKRRQATMQLPIHGRGRTWRCAPRGFCYALDHNRSAYRSSTPAVSFVGGTLEKYATYAMAPLKKK